MNWTYLSPILLLCVSNVFMTFAWVRSGLPKANEMVQRTISRYERPELRRGAGRPATPRSLRSRGASFSKLAALRKEKLSQRPELGRGAGEPAAQFFQLPRPR
jgi:hypothetical protein